MAGDRSLTADEGSCGAVKAGRLIICLATCLPLYFLTVVDGQERQGRPTGVVSETASIDNVQYPISREEKGSTNNQCTFPSMLR